MQIDKDKKKKQKTILIVLSILLVLTALSATTYSLFYTESVAANPSDYSTGLLSIEAKSKSDNIVLDNALPMEDSEGIETTPYVFTIKNNGNVDYKFDIKLLSTSDNPISPQYIKLKVDDSSVTTLSTLTNSIIKSNVILRAKESIDITLRVWLDINTPNTEMGKSFNSKIVIDGQAIYTETNYDIPSTETLNNLGLSVDTTHTPDFSTCSGNSCIYYDASTEEETPGHGDGTNGIYAAPDDLGTSYYFRGAVENNYVSFAGKTWRIVRINGDGTIRIALNESAGRSAFNEESEDNAYVGYMYGTPGSSSYEATHTNTNDSTIKTFLDNWYDTNLSSYSSYIADSIFCNDRSISDVSDHWGEATTNTGIGEDVTAYFGYKRTYVDHNPSLICPQNNDKFTVSSSIGNGDLTKPIGLLTIDEYIMAGAAPYDSGTNNYYRYNSSSGAFYLYDNDNWYWSMSPDGYAWGNALVSRVYYFGYTDLINVYRNLAVRPAVSLKSDAITGGNGTIGNPFTVG